MQRYFIKNNQIIENYIYISDSDFHHIKNVMRMKIGDKVYFCGENENCFLAILVEYKAKEVVFEIVDTLRDSNELDFEVTIAQGVVRKDKQEEVIRRITELGASKYLPVIMDRSVIKPVYKDSYQERLQRIVKEASEQSHRFKMMEVSSFISFDEFLKLSQEYDLLLFAYEEDSYNTTNYFKKYLKDFTGKSILVLVGPEGGISDKEVKLLKEYSFKSIGLGKRILRTETAPLYIMSAISYELELGEIDES